MGGGGGHLAAEVVSVGLGIWEEVGDDVGEGDCRVDKEDGVVVERGSPDGEVKSFDFAHIVIKGGSAECFWEEVSSYIEWDGRESCPLGGQGGAVECHEDGGRNNIVTCLAGI